MNYPSAATAAFNTVERLFKLITWTAVTGVVFIAYQKNNDWAELILLLIMSTMIVVGTVSTATLFIAAVAGSVPLERGGTLPARLALYAVALMAMAALAFGLTGAIHTLVLKI